jgi:hypothetical protein
VKMGKIGSDLGHRTTFSDFSHHADSDDGNYITVSISFDGILAS